MTTPSTPTSANGPVPLGGLLSETFAYCKAHWKPLAVGVVMFGVVMGAVPAMFAAMIGDAMNEVSLNLDTDRMQQLADRMEQGDETAMDELEKMLAGEFDGMTDNRMAGSIDPSEVEMMSTFAPAALLLAFNGEKMSTLALVIGVPILLAWLFSLLAFAYYVIVAVEGKDVNGTLSRVKSVFFSLFLVNLWSMLRTFVWIPILGLIPAIVLGPRFVAAPLIHLVEGKGVTASVSDSYRRTRGYWAKIFFNVIGAGLVAFLVTAVINLALGLLSFVSLPVVIIARQIVSQAVAAYMAVFVVRLSHTILKHPIA